MDLSKVSNNLNIRGVLLSADVRATSYDEKDRETKEATGNKVEAISGRLKLITNLETIFFIYFTKRKYKSTTNLINAIIM